MMVHFIVEKMGGLWSETTTKVTTATITKEKKKKTAQHSKSGGHAYWLKDHTHRQQTSRAY